MTEITLSDLGYSEFFEDAWKEHVESDGFLLARVTSEHKEASGYGHATKL